MELKINIQDYFSDEKIKEIAEEELRAAFRERFRKEADVERVITNLSVEYVHALVAEQWDGDFDELLREKVRDAIEKGVGYYDGTCKTDERYKEIFRLDEMLTAKEIPHVFHKMMDGWQIIYPEDGKKRVMDAIENYGSYGNDQDLLEIMGLLTTEEKKCDSVLGYLTAEEVFERIEKHWNENKTVD